MLTAAFKIAIRNLWRNKSFSFINIFGLSVGLSAVLLITLYIQHEISYDRFHPDYKDIYLVKEKVFWSGKWNNIEQSVTPLGPAMKDGVPEVENTVRFMRWFDMTVEVGNQKATEDNVVFTDPSVFEMLGFPLIYGEVGKALSGVNTVALSRTIAEKYFGDENPLGQTIIAQDKYTYEVVAVFEDIPDNSTIKMNMAISYNTVLGPDFLGKREMENWRSFNNETFAKLIHGTDPESVNKKFENLILLRDGEDGWEHHQPYLYPISSYHLKNDYGRLNLLGAVAFFILLIASINFMNLSTSRASTRAKEIGVRKVLGSNRAQLFRQFILESMLLTSIALVFAFIIVSSALPWFNNVSGKTLALNQLGIYAIPVLLLVLVLVGGLAGLYPAIYLSGFRPVQVIKGKVLKRNGKVTNLRKGLVVFQFVMSIILIVGTITVVKQFQYLQNRDLGFNRDNLIYLSFEGNSLKTKAETFKQEVEKHPAVISASISSRIFGKINGGVWGIKKPGDDEMFAVYTVFTDKDILLTLDGRLAWTNPNYLDKKLSVEDGFFINEATINALGLDLQKDDRLILESVEEKPVLGVLKDFHVHSLYRETKPVVLTSLRTNSEGGPNKYDCRFLLVRVQPEETKEVIQYLEKVWHEFDPALAFNFGFVDDAVDRQYRSESRLASILGGFAVVGIVVALLGLLGLSAYDTERRIKEIGVRKVLGASTLQVVMQLVREFSLPVFISLLLACPITWYAIKLYLNEFPYRVGFDVVNYLVIASGLLIIALATVGIQTIKAANMNPTETLRSE